jgi:sigma-E factor negative regulatory protein RseB
MRQLLFCAAAFGFAAANEVFADELSANLTRAADAARTVTYEGVAVYRGADQFEVFKVQHRFLNGSERERISNMTGDPVQLLRTDDRVIWVLPKGRTVMRERPTLKGVLTQMTAERLAQLASWYRFLDEGGDRIANRSCVGILVAPRDAYRFGYEVWYDKATHIPLKISMVGPQGEMLEQLMFTEVSFPQTIADAAFDTEIDTSKFSLVTNNEKPLNLAPAADEKPENSQVSFGRLPPGFRVISHEQKPLPNDQPGQMEHLLLSDGLASVSVFSAIHPPHADKTFSGISHVGSVQAYGRMVGDYHITIVGEVPSATIRMIGDNVSPVFTPDAADAAPAAPAIHHP